MKAWEAFYGPNVGYVLELYDRFQDDPESVDHATRAYFESLGEPRDATSLIGVIARKPTVTPPRGSSNGHKAVAVAQPKKVDVAGNGTSNGRERTVAIPAVARDTKPDAVGRIVRAARLARSIREYGHLAALIDPLGAPRPGDPMLRAETHRISDEDLTQLPASIVWPAAGPEMGTCLEAMDRLRAIYSGPIGYEFDHIQDFSERAWLHEVVESGTFRTPLPSARKKDLLERLSQVEGFERYLHRIFVGQKRFSIEGNDMLVPMLDELIQRAVQDGTQEVLIGMAHRGRLNVLAHVLEKPYEAILSEFHAPGHGRHGPAGGTPNMGYGWTGDVKYHLGGHRTMRGDDAAPVQITMSDNPSHLEFVNPVVEGFARAAQDTRNRPGPPSQDVTLALPVTIHGDAAFPGEGVVAETLNLSRLPGYETGGTVRIIVNNQIGFTTNARAGRSTLYASDLAKGFEIPILHVNADDAEACISAIRLAYAYRKRFSKDILIDLVGYRRWGHNEGDEPSFTQPRLYAQVTSHPSVREVYGRQLEAEGIVSSEEAAVMLQGAQKRLEEAREKLEHLQEKTIQPDAKMPRSVHASPVTRDALVAFGQTLLTPPDGFNPHAKLRNLLGRRLEAYQNPGGVDWALAENLAFATILSDGTPVRLTGQDTERGTFSQRHLVWHDSGTDQQYVPLQHLPTATASFAIYNSPLTEAAAIGFEYGYSVHAPETLVLWEAQFGDFVNAGQVLIDQFLVAARAKWRQDPSLVMLLPHGYEGQGPEHSSGRVERFLQLAAEDNLRIVNCTTSAQYFHALRLQAASLCGDRRPMVVMTPKSLLRHPLAASSLDDLADETFEPVLDDAGAASRRAGVERLILCSGKVAVDLTTTARGRVDPVDWVAVARLEQLYPFPEDQLQHVIRGYPNLTEIVWLQEEPRNMGAWTYMEPRLRTMLSESLPLKYLGRPERASPAEGSADAHAADQSRIIDDAFGGERKVKLETHGVHDVS